MLVQHWGITQRDCGISILGILAAQDPEQPSADPAVSSGLD